jgi:hypothetical protein
MQEAEVKEQVVVVEHMELVVVQVHVMEKVVVAY